MSNPWGKIAKPVATENLSDIMSEEIARGMQIKEEMKFAETITSEQTGASQEDISPEVLKQIEVSNIKKYCDSDAIIAKVLQCQYDKEHDEELSRIEKKRNGTAKVSVSFDNYRHVPSSLVYDSGDEDEDVNKADKKDWDRFETNEKEFASLPKRGFKVNADTGEKVTKHDSVINGRRNACRVMAFPPEFCTGDGAGFDMKLPNSVFNSLKAHSRWDQARRHKMLDRKESQATAVMGLDERTKLLLFKLINNGMLAKINGVISTGKESVVLHADSDPSFPDLILPKECAIKVFKTTLNEFKTRDKYIEADYRFKDRFSKQNPRKIVHMWAEKEMHNMMRMQKIGINCPDMICLKKHILVMSFIGKDTRAAPKLKEIILKEAEWQMVYEEVVDCMYKMFNVGHMIHADLSEYNILWHEDKCWIIDVSQSVEPDHPSGLEFLLRDCTNISNFFEKKGVVGVRSPDQLFKYITGFEEIDVNLLEGVHSKFNALSERFEIEPDDSRNVTYPFDYCWQKSNEKGTDLPIRQRTKSENSDSSTDDDFEEMWEHAKKHKLEIDKVADFGNAVDFEVDDSVNDSLSKKIDTVEVNNHVESTGTSSSKNCQNIEKIF